ncbi:hypothetical protein PVAP13_2NG261006 [Panicum virgatum]|uniref:Uncharacterized protein n=1 Tax=Panicum virgatum TaxID=38727 RepID=A0A8T0VA91_PANVG|nr:hypothetical protein PVAP13_2NG261006 [Panicum virgatum]
MARLLHAAPPLQLDDAAPPRVLRRERGVELACPPAAAAAGREPGPPAAAGRPCSPRHHGRRERREPGLRPPRTRARPCSPAGWSRREEGRHRYAARLAAPCGAGSASPRQRRERDRRGGGKGRRPMRDACSLEAGGEGSPAPNLAVAAPRGGGSAASTAPFPRFLSLSLSRRPEVGPAPAKASRRAGGRGARR